VNGELDGRRAAASELVTAGQSVAVMTRNAQQATTEMTASAERATLTLANAVTSLQQAPAQAQPDLHSLLTALATNARQTSELIDALQPRPGRFRRLLGGRRAAGHSTSTRRRS